MQKQSTTITNICILLCAITTITIIGYSSYTTPIFAQNNTNTKNVTDFATFFTGNKDFQHCSSINPSQCADTINVLYQDNSTIALQSTYVDSIWKAVSVVKKDGYKIDGITSYTTGGGGVGIDNIMDVNILVAMSR